MKRTLNFIGHLHHKNVIGARLLDFNVEFNGSSNDIIIVSDGHVKQTSAKLTMFGPQIPLTSVGNYSSVNMLSQWNLDISKALFPNTNGYCLPFPVDVNSFVPASKIGKPILYFKKRDQALLKQVVSHLKDFILFNYEAGYSEDQYKRSISQAPFAIWLGCHESQGFALQECLSADVPILVIDVNSLCDEVSKNGISYFNKSFNKYKATSAQYFDQRCGIKTSVENWKRDFDVFMSKINKYSPREYVLENLAAGPLTNKWKEFIESHA